MNNMVLNGVPRCWRVNKTVIYRKRLSWVSQSRHYQRSPCSTQSVPLLCSSIISCPAPALAPALFCWFIVLTLTLGHGKCWSSVGGPLSHSYRISLTCPQPSRRRTVFVEEHKMSQDQAEQNIQMWKVKKLIKSLDSARGCVAPPLTPYCPGLPMVFTFFLNKSTVQALP